MTKGRNQAVERAEQASEQCGMHTNVHQHWRDHPGTFAGRAAGGGSAESSRQDGRAASPKRFLVDCGGQGENGGSGNLFWVHRTACHAACCAADSAGPNLNIFGLRTDRNAVSAPMFFRLHMLIGFGALDVALCACTGVLLNMPYHPPLSGCGMWAIPVPVGHG